MLTASEHCLLFAKEAPDEIPRSATLVPNALATAQTLGAFVGYVPSHAARQLQ
jgi:hypothetical protein